MTWRTLYPLRGTAEQADAIIVDVAAQYGLAPEALRGLAGTGSGRFAIKSGLVYVARVEAARRCLAACIRPRVFAEAMGIHKRTAGRFYEMLWKVGLGPACTRKAS